MTRGTARGLEAPDPVLEAQIRAGLDQVETALEKAVRADYELLGEAASYVLAAGGKMTSWKIRIASARAMASKA